jgi:hypothetical protein
MILVLSGQVNADFLQSSAYGDWDGNSKSRRTDKGIRRWVDLNTDLEVFPSFVAFRALGLPWHAASSNAHFRFRGRGGRLAACQRKSIEMSSSAVWHDITEVESCKTKSTGHDSEENL